MLWYKLTITRAKKVNRYERFVLINSSRVYLKIQFTIYILRKKHFPSIDTFNSFYRIHCAVLQGFPGPVKNPNRILWHGTLPSLHSVRLMNEWWSAHHSLFFGTKNSDVSWYIYAHQNEGLDFTLLEYM